MTTTTARTSAATAAGVTPSDDAVAAPGLGVQGFYQFQDVPLSQKQSIGVNLANGNLVERDTDLTMTGPGIGMNLERFYNGLSSRAGAYGPKWSISVGVDVGLEVGTGTGTGGNGIPTGTVVFRAPSGFRAKFTAVSGSTTAFTAPSGLNSDLVKNADGTYTITYRKSNEKLSFTSGGYLTKDADRNGNALTYAYNGDNTLASVTDAVGRVTTFQYNGGLTGQITGITDPAGRTVGFQYDASARLSKVTDPRSKAATYTYDSSGRLSTISTYGSSVTQVGYDTSGRVASLTRYLTRSSITGQHVSTTFSYTSGSTIVTDDNGHAATYTIDTSGRVTATKDALGHTRSASWTANSDVQTSTDAMGATPSAGNVSTYTYDSSNNPIQVSAPTGATAKATYGTGGTCGSTDAGHPYQAKCATDASGNQSSYTYDGPGNLLSSKDSTSGGTGVTTATYTYQGTNGVSCGGRPGQRCSSKTGNGGVTSYSYDSNGNLTKVTPPSPLPASTYGYDSIGRMTSSTDGKGQQVTYGYDAADHLTSTTYLTGQSVQVGQFYTDDGYQYATSDPVNATTGVTYDALNRQVARTASNTSATLSVTLDGVGNTLTSTAPSGTTSYGYDAANHLVSLAQPGGSCVNPTSGTSDSTDTSNKCTRFVVDNNGHEIKVTYPGGTTQSTTYDASSRPTAITTSSSAGALSAQRYSYQAPGTTGSTGDRARLQTRTWVIGHNFASIPDGAVDTFGYDSLGRLTSTLETTTSGSTTTTNASWTYAYDADGNRTSRSRSGNTGAAAVSTTYGYDAADELTTMNGSAQGMSSDANGNETGNRGSFDVGIAARTDTVNVRDQLVGLATTNSDNSTGTTTLSYAGNDNTIRTGIATTSSNSASTSANLLTGPLGLQNSLDGSGATTSYTRTPNGTLVAATAPDGTSTYFGSDITGSVTVETNASGAAIARYTYDPFGAVRATGGAAIAAANPYRYGGAYGAYTDNSTGLIKMGARYYNAAQGRFTQPDPSGQEANAYLYAGSDPINGLDPTGLLTETYGITGCYFVCINIGYSFDDSGASGLSYGFGVGTPGLSGGLTFGSGELSTGVAGTISCSAGPFSLGVDSGGGVSGGIGTNYSTGECDLGVGGTYVL